MVTYNGVFAQSGTPDGSSTGGPCSLGMEFGLSTTGYRATHIWFYRYDTTVNPSSARIFQVVAGTPATGTAIAPLVTFPSYDATQLGWISSAMFSPTALLLAAPTTYRVVVYFPTSYSVTTGYWTTGGPGAANITNGIITGYTAANATNAVQGQFISGGALTFPTGGTTSNYWLDVTLTNTVNNKTVSVSKNALNRASFI